MRVNLQLLFGDNVRVYDIGELEYYPIEYHCLYPMETPQVSVLRGILSLSLTHSLLLFHSLFVSPLPTPPENVCKMSAQISF